MEKKEIWELIITRPAEKKYDKSSKQIKSRIDQCFEELEKNPVFGGNIRPLTGQLKGLYRYRIGDWRVIYRIYRDSKVVEIIAILPRAKAYG